MERTREIKESYHTFSIVAYAHDKKKTHTHTHTHKTDPEIVCTPRRERVGVRRGGARSAVFSWRIPALLLF